MHSSWLYPGGSSGPRQTGETASGDRPQNSSSSNSSNGTTFDINSYVRSLNLHGTHLNGGFPFKGVTNSNNKHDWNKATAGRSLNEFLNVLNESVDRVAECGSQDRSNVSSFGSFRSGFEDRNPADLNDLIGLVSDAANEFREINSSNVKYNYRRNVDLNYQTNPVNSLDIGMRTLVHPEIRARNEISSTLELPKYHTSSNEITSGPPLKKRKSPQSHSKDTRNNDFSTTTELVEIYSENQSPGIKRANISAESLEKLRYLETPRTFLPEVIRMAKEEERKKNRGNWIHGRINFNDELWPINHSGNMEKNIPPYFTGSTSKNFRLRTTDKKFINDTNRSMNSSRSSPIFVGAGEALSEPLEIIVVPTRDREDCIQDLEETKISQDTIINRANPIDIIKISPEDNLLNATATKLNEKFSTLKEKDKLETITNISLNIPEESEIVSSVEDKIRRNACVKVLSKRHRNFCRHSKKNGQKKSIVNAEDNGISDLSSNSQSSIISARKSPLQRFYEESGNVVSEDEKLMGSVRGEDDSVETQIGICGKTYRVYNHFNTKVKSEESKIVGNEKNKLPVRWKDLEKYQEPIEASSKRPSSVDTYRSVDCSKKFESLKNNLQKCRGENSTQPVWRPAGSCKVVTSSTSSSYVSKQSKIAQYTSRIRPKTTETLNKSKETTTEAISKSKVSVVRKNPSQDIIAEKNRGPFLARKNEAHVKISNSKQRPETPKIPSESGQYVVKSMADKNSSLCSRDQFGRVNSSNLKTTIPVLKPKTVINQMRRDIAQIVSKEETFSKSTSLKNSKNSSPGPTKQILNKSPKDCQSATKELYLCSETEDTPFDSKLNTDDEDYSSDFKSITNLDKICAVNFSSNESIAVNKNMFKVSSSKAVTENLNERNYREEEINFESKYQNKHARSLQMLKNILSHQGVSVEGVNKSTRDIRSKILTDPVKKSRIPGVKKSSETLISNQINTGLIGASKTLFEKLAVLTETLPDREESDEQDSSVQSISSFTESTISYPRSMRVAEEQCCLSSETSIDIETTKLSEKSSKETLYEINKQVSNVSTEMDDDYRRSIYVDAAVSPYPSKTDIKTFEAAETQTGIKLLNKILDTEEIEPEIVNAFTETNISSVSKDANTDFKMDNVDATSQIDYTVNSKNIASGKDFSGIQCPSKDVNTDRNDSFMRSRGVCFRGPRKIDGGSQFDPTGISTASGRDYVRMENVSESVNTDRQDYLFEDRSVNVLATTVEESCQIDRVKIVNVAVGDYSLEVKSSPEEILRTKVQHDLRTIETVVVKDVDVVQWQSSTTFNNSRINCGSSCSSNSSLVAWRPKYCQRSSFEKLQMLENRVPKEAIVALEMATEIAQNWYKAIGIYQENLASKRVKEMVYNESVEKIPIFVDRERKFVSEIKETCSFRKNSRIKSLLDSNLEKIQPEINNQSTNELDAKESPMVSEVIGDLMNDLLTDVSRIVESESEYSACEDIDVSFIKEEHFVHKKIQDNTIKLTEIIEEEYIDEEKLLSTSKTFDLSLFSRNSLLTVIYGTVCSFVFWSLQFSITCDSV